MGAQWIVGTAGLGLVLVLLRQAFQAADAGHYRRMWGWSALTGAASLGLSFGWATLEESTMLVRNIVLGGFGAAAGACFTIYAGYVFVGYPSVPPKTNDATASAGQPRPSLPAVTGPAVTHDVAPARNQASSAKASASAAADDPVKWEPGDLGNVVVVEPSEIDETPRVRLIKFYGARYTGSEPLVEVKAYAVPQIMGSDLPMRFYDPHKDVTNKSTILPREEFFLYFDVRPTTPDNQGLKLQDYLRAYGGITIRLEAESKIVFTRKFSYEEIERMLTAKQDAYLDQHRLK